MEKELTATFEKETKRKLKYSAQVLGMDIGIYIDKLAEIPSKLIITLSKEGE